MFFYFFYFFITKEKSDSSRSSAFKGRCNNVITEAKDFFSLSADTTALKAKNSAILKKSINALQYHHLLCMVIDPLNIDFPYRSYLFLRSTTDAYSSNLGFDFSCCLCYTDNSSECNIVSRNS